MRHRKSEPRFEDKNLSFDDKKLSLDDDEFDLGPSSSNHDRRPPRRKPKADNTLAYGFAVFVILGLAGVVYFSWWQNIMPEEGKKPPQIVKTPPLVKSSSLKIDSQPSGAKLFLSGNPLGLTPYFTENLKPGEYKVELELNGYQKWSKAVRLEEGKVEQISAQLKEGRFAVRIQTTPAGAKIRLIGRKEPFAQGMRLSPGTHKIEMTAVGHKPSSKEIVVLDAPQSLVFVLDPWDVHFRLKVKLDPPQAEGIAKIHLAGVEEEYSAKGFEVTPGTYHLEVTAPGYRKIKESVTIPVTKGDKTLDIKLHGDPVALHLRVTPKNAQIKIQNSSEPYTPGMKLLPGQYQLLVSAPGYKSLKQSISLTQTQTIELVLPEDSYQLQIDPVPKDAEVSFVAPAGVAYVRENKYAPGPYEVKVSAPGYKTVTRKIELSDEDVKVQIKLSKERYALTIKTEPANARVKFLDQTFAFKQGMQVSPGRYQIEVSAKGFQPVKQWVEITDQSVTETISLGDDKFAVTIVTEPANASVRFINSEVTYKKGAKLAPGIYEVEVGAPGYQKQRRKLTVSNKAQELKIKLGEEAYTLTVKTTPDKAQIKLLNYPEEYQPGMKLVPGNYEIEASIQGYAPMMQTVTLTDKDETVFILLKEQQRTLTVETIPKGAKIEIVDSSQEFTQGMSLPAGNYQIRASAPNYKSAVQFVELKGSNVVLKMRLEWEQVIKPAKNFEPRMIVVPKGSFRFGSPKTEIGRKDHEGPQLDVTFAQAFAISQTEITFDQYDAYSKDTGEKFADDGGWGRANRPVIHVSWGDAVNYAKWLSEKTGQKYRLPTEAEWEYAAKAKTDTPFHTGNCINSQQASFAGDYSYAECARSSSANKTQPVATFPANAFKLHDMHGNVAEWVEDCWFPNLAGSPPDGSARTLSGCNQGVVRGGNWDSVPRELRSSFRMRKAHNTRKKNIGFRVVRELH